MSFFGALARATGLASPASEAPGSSSTSTASSSKLNQHLVRDAVSPINRNATSSNKNTPRQASRAMDLHTVKGSKIKGNKISKAKGHDRKDKRKSLWDFAHISSFFGKDQDGEEESEGDMEGDTLVDCDSPIPTTEDGNDRTMVEDARENVTPEPVKVEKIAPIVRPSKRVFSYDDPRVAKWTQDEIWLFNKLAMRGLEPLLPQSMAMDFQSFPDRLFSRNPSRVFLSSHQGSETGHANALCRLIAAGPWVRNNVASNLSPERPIHRELESYYKWSLRDGGVQCKEHIPVVVIVSPKYGDESIRKLVKRATQKFHELAHLYREKWRHPDSDGDDTKERYVHDLPTFYGFIIKFSVLSIVTYDSAKPDAPIRTLATSNWARQGQEVWYAFAVAIAMVKARNYLIQLDEEGELGPRIVESDPDL